MLVRDNPPAVDFAQADGQTEAVLGILLQLLSGPATKQCVCKGDIVPGDDVRRTSPLGSRNCCQLRLRVLLVGTFELFEGADLPRGG